MKRSAVFSFVFSALLFLFACRDSGDSPPPMYGESLGSVGQPLMPTVNLTRDGSILDNVRTQLPEIEPPELSESVEIKETPESIYLAFKDLLGKVLSDPEAAMSVAGTFHHEDNRAVTAMIAARLLKLGSLYEKFAKRVEEKFPEQWTKIRQKFVKIAIGSSLKYSDGEPPGVLITVGSPVGKPNRYFVPILPMGERFYIIWKFGDLQSRTLPVLDGLMGLYDELEGDQLSAEQFEKRFDDLLVAFLRLPFENNPELSNVKGRKASAEPEMEYVKKGKPVTKTAKVPAEEPGHETESGGGAKREGEAEPERPAGRTSVFGGLLRAARSAYQKTTTKTPATSQAGEPEAKDESQDDDQAQDANKDAKADTP